MNRKTKKKAPLLIFFAVLSVVMFWVSLRFFSFWKADCGLTTLFPQINQTASQTVESLKHQPFFFSCTLHSLLYAFICGGVTLLIGVAVAFYEKNLRPGEEHGSARFGTKREAKRFIDKEFQKNYLLTQTERLRISNEGVKPKYHRNQNVLLFGGAGAGKTRFVGKPNLLQMNASYIVTDPKGLMAHEVGGVLERHGYQIKIFDLVNRANSDCFNPFVYINNEDDILLVVDNLLKNSKTDKSKKGGDPFWDEGCRLLLTAIFSLVKETFPPEEQIIKTVGKLLRFGNSENVQETAVSLDHFFDAFRKQVNSDGSTNEEHFAICQYEIFKTGAEKTRDSILVTIGSQLAPFNVKSVAELTSRDTLDLSSMMTQKTVLFVILPDTNTAFNFLASILFQVAFEKFVAEIDQFHQGRSPIPIHFFLDEFANCGEIPDFEKKLAVIRSRGISVTIVLQSLAQLKERYKDNWEGLVANCDSILYLGGNEQSTHKYLSELIGKETIDVIDFSKSYGGRGGFSKSYRKQARSLLTPDEVSNLPRDKCLLKISGTPVFLSDKYNYETHPLFPQTADGKGEWWEWDKRETKITTAF